MRKLIGVLIVLIVIWIGWFLLQSAEKSIDDQHAKQPVGETALAGLPYELESSLSEAKTRGAPALRAWLSAYGSRVKDPRLAAIQLDYVSLVFRNDAAEARSVFNAVRQRVPATSPVFERVKQMEATYQ
jgi:hypothetical protein